MRLTTLLISAILIGGAGLTYAGLRQPDRQPVEFYSGHTHEGETTVGAPAHSGGTDSYGCHNGSVPYHCH